MSRMSSKSIKTKVYTTSFLSKRFLLVFFYIVGFFWTRFYIKLVFQSKSHRDWSLGSLVKKYRNKISNKGELTF